MQDFKMTEGGRLGCHSVVQSVCVAVQLISVAEIRENDDANSVQKLLAKHLLVAGG